LGDSAQTKDDNMWSEHVPHFSENGRIGGQRRLTGFGPVVPVHKGDMLGPQNMEKKWWSASLHKG
jgi:hypothetical protein